VLGKTLLCVRAKLGKFNGKVERARRAELRKRSTELRARVAREDQALPRDVGYAPSVNETADAKNVAHSRHVRYLARSFALHERRRAVRHVDAGVRGPFCCGVAVPPTTRIAVR
jgi:hypothetical protein